MTIPRRTAFRFFLVSTTAALLSACAGHGPKPAATAETWTFAVSGDSRNCGNIVMPAIARDAITAGASFYWHLGDLRRTSNLDEDYVREARFAGTTPSRSTYLGELWSDFRSHQVAPFGQVPFFVGIGNHETVPPKTRDDFRREFADLLDRPELRDQRAADGQPADPKLPPSYYHWTRGGVDFVYLDNATDNSFDAEQVAWFERVVAADMANASIRTLVVGMHEQLPHGLGDNHSMCDSTEGVTSGERVYRKLVQVRSTGKRVYVLASHSHFYLAKVFDTAYWRDPAHHGAVLPGWIVGTAGAVRYPLPAEVAPEPDARAHVYGYLQGAVHPDGEVRFTFRELSEQDLQQARPADYTPSDVTFCFAQNPDPSLVRPPSPSSCSHAAD